jgi:uncharacterized protein DUF3667
MSIPGTELTQASDSRALVPQAPAATCANCGALVAGNFCSHCGQRLQHQVHSLPEFLGEAAEVITHADSRVWRTFMPLLFRPGFLTQQYLAGRRASYLPPFRLYIVLSVVFFLMVSLATRVTKHTDALPANVHVATAASLDELQKELAATKDPEEQALLRNQIKTWTAVDAKVTGLTSDSNCETRISAGSLPQWLRARMVTGCQKITADNGEEMRERMIHNAGRAMFVFLPLIAALMKLLYWHPRRFYVEHLLLLLHNHAFIFVSVSILLGLQMVVPSNDVMGWLSTVLWLYIVWYLYRSMRRVYAQSRLRTALKFAVLASAYFFCAIFTFALATVYSAFTL